MLNNNYSYTQLLFLRKILITLTIILMLFLFLSQQNFYIFLGLFFVFCLFLFQKDFDIFHVLLFGTFLCVFNNVCLLFLFKETTFTKKDLTVFLIFFCFFVDSFDLLKVLFKRDCLVITLLSLLLSINNTKINQNYLLLSGKCKKKEKMLKLSCW